MSKLYSYCITCDTGAAPNPFGGVCTLVICKPVIRRTAEPNDWIVATGSKHNGFENKVVYAMKVSQKMKMEHYDEYCKQKLTVKIPNDKGNTYEERVGDCIYDFSVSPAKIRSKVHNEGNRVTDLGGKYALLSDHFYYFGESPIDLPEHLLKIVKHGQGHKSNSNEPYYNDFVIWINNPENLKNKIFSPPQFKNLFGLDCDFENLCAGRDKELDDIDERLACD